MRSVKKIFLVFCVLVGALAARENTFIFGINGGIGANEIQRSGLEIAQGHQFAGMDIWRVTSAPNNAAGGPAYGVNIGYEFFLRDAEPYQHALRLYFDYSRVQFSDLGYLVGGINYNLFTLNADYHYYATPRFSLFGGLGLGENFAQVEGAYDDQKALTMGINLGLGYEVAKFLELELKFRYFSSAFTRETFFNPNTTTRTRVVPSGIARIMLGVNFKF